MNEQTKNESKPLFSISGLFSDCFAPGRRLRIHILLAIFAFAFALRLARSFQIERIEKDGVQLLMMAEDIAENGLDDGFAENPRLPPLHIFLVAAGMRAGIPPEVAGILISVLSGALLVFPVFFIAQNLFKTFLPAMISAIVVAVYPNLARVAAEVLRDPLFQLFSIVAIWMLIEGVKSHKLRFHLVAGICAALAAATRSEGVEILVAYCLYCACSLAVRAADDPPLRMRIRRTLFSVAVFVVGFAAVSAPLELAVSRTMSQWHAIDMRIVSIAEAFVKYPKSELDHKIK